MKRVLLCILDGVGIRDEEYGNAFYHASKPNFDYLWNRYGHSLLSASGKDVGLPDGQMGNSEVGHTNIGAGRIVYQSLELINKSFSDGVIKNSSSLNEVFDYVKENGSKLHVMGLFSDGGVHSHIEHFLNMLNIAHDFGVSRIYAHVITDGRDTKDDIASSYIDRFYANGVGKLASISGRYYAMDRDKRYERTNMYYDVITNGSSDSDVDVYEYIDSSYKDGIYDEFIKPCLLDRDGYIDKDDAVIWVNFRPDRAKQIVGKLEDSGVRVLSIMKISDEISSPYILDKVSVSNTLGEYIAGLGLSQLRIAETEKYAHVTYFFDGGKELDLPRCDKVLIPSKKVATYDLDPSMSAYEITFSLLDRMDKYDFIVLNFANGDMVGHTGNYEATLASVEAMDSCLGKIYNRALELDTLLVVTADHGNCDYMIDSDGNKVTTHSLSKVPFIVCCDGVLVDDGKLSDIAPSLLYLMGLNVPSEMSGRNLIK